MLSRDKWHMSLKIYLETFVLMSFFLLSKIFPPQQIKAFAVTPFIIVFQK